MNLKNETLREATKDDYRKWAHTPMAATFATVPVPGGGERVVEIIHRISGDGDQVIEENSDGRVYVLKRVTGTMSQVEQVIEKPSQELLEAIRPKVKQK